jgi:hypothetical protein
VAALGGVCTIYVISISYDPCPHKQCTAFSLFCAFFKFLHPALAPPISHLTPSKAALQRVVTKAACKMDMGLCKAAKG